MGEYCCAAQRGFYSANLATLTKSVNKRMAFAGLLQYKALIWKEYLTRLRAKSMKSPGILDVKERVQLLALSSLVLVWLGVLQLVDGGSEGGSSVP